MLAVGISAWQKGEIFMFRAAAAFSFAIYYVLADVNRRDLLLTKANAVTTARLLLTRWQTASTAIWPAASNNSPI